MGFNLSYLSFEETKMFPKVMMDYVKGEAYLTPFYLYQPNIAEFKKAIDTRSNIDRKLLAKVISERYAKNVPNASDATKKNIKLLADDKCFTVTTGHQLCLFTGPLYFIYKIVTIINLAKKLKEQYPDCNFVPVYWLASEDHDFAEINHAYVFGKKIEWSPDTSVIGGPVGRMNTSSIKPVLDNLFTMIGENNTAELKTIIGEAYTKFSTLSEAMLYIVDKLFGKYGLVCVDANNAELKKSFAAIIADELVNQSSFKKISETNKKLADVGVQPQVNAREINLFYIDEKGRNRIEKQGDKYVVVDTNVSFSQSDILEEVKKSPEKFSPNVVLRPVYQQSILPNIAYIGGPAEVAYWLQLKGVFEHHKIAYPVIMPRNSAMIVDKGTTSKMEKLKVNIKDLFREIEELVKEYVLKNADGSLNFEAEKEELNKIYQAIIQKTKGIDPTLSALPEAELQKQYNALKGIETKLIRAQKQKEETSLNQLRKLKEKLFPDGELQERHDNFIPFYLNNSGLIDELVQKLEPFEFKMMILGES